MRDDSKCVFINFYVFIMQCPLNIDLEVVKKINVNY